MSKTTDEKLKAANLKIINLEKENERLCFALIDNGQSRLVRLEKDNFALCAQIDRLYEQMASEREDADKKRKESCRTISQLQRKLENLYDEWVTCNGCGKLLRTEPDGMWWEPSFIVDGRYRRTS